MARRRPEVEEVAYGRFERFDADAPGLPDHLEFTTTIPAAVGREFGYLLRIRHARGGRLRCEIRHPGIPDGDGRPQPPFPAEAFINTNDFRFFLGDTFWEPLHDKLGAWTLVTWLDGKEIARRTFRVVSETDAADAGDRLEMQ